MGNIGKFYQSVSGVCLRIELDGCVCVRVFCRCWPLWHKWKALIIFFFFFFFVTVACSTYIFCSIFNNNCCWGAPQLCDFVSGQTDFRGRDYTWATSNCDIIVYWCLNFFSFLSNFSYAWWLNKSKYIAHSHTYPQNV